MSSIYTLSNFSNFALTGVELQDSNSNSNSASSIPLFIRSEKCSQKKNVYLRAKCGEGSVYWSYDTHFNSLLYWPKSRTNLSFTYSYVVRSSRRSSKFVKIVSATPVLSADLSYSCDYTNDSEAEKISSLYRFI